MKKLILLAMLVTTPSLAASVTTQGAWNHTANSNYGDGGGVNVRAQAPVYGDLDIGVEYGYHGAMSHSGYGSLSGHSLLGEAIYNVPVDWAWKPYLLGGWGWSWWDFSRSQDTINRGIEVTLGNAFAQKYGLGADYRLSDHWAVSLEWDYFVAHVPKKSFYESDGSFSNILGGDTVGEEETAVALGIKYSF